MITITLFTIAAAIIIWLFWVNSEHDRVDGVVAGMVVSFVLGVVTVYPSLRAFEGLLEHYSTGVREGYLTKASQKGFVFKTFEAELQVGTGNMASLQQPWQFSIADIQVMHDVESLLGKKVRVKYNQWFIAPWRQGETQYIAWAVDPLE
jgi:hypothetical protein